MNLNQLKTDYFPFLMEQHLEWHFSLSVPVKFVISDKSKQGA